MASKDKRTNNKEAYEEENDPLNPDNTQVKIVDKSYIYEEDESQNPSPFVGASWISLITFWWLNGLIRRGWKEQLTKKQIQKLRPKDDSEVVTANLQAYWDKNKVTDDTDINYLWRGILSVYWKHFVLGGICQIFRLGLLVPQPVFITLIVKYLRGNEDVSMQEAYLSAAAVVACTFLYTIPYTMYRYTIGTSAVRARAAISAMIFTKMLKLSERGWQGTTTGSIINLLASDVEKLQFGMLYLNLTWPACIIGSVVSGLLFWTFGTAFLAGLGVYIIAVISQVVFGLRIGKMRLIIGERGDKRQTLMHDIISAIKMIKIHCWEDPYADQVSAARKQEVAAIRKMGILSSPMEVINTVTGRVAIFFTLLVYALQGNQWTITDILYLIAWCELVRLALCGDLLIGSYYGAEVYFSSLRIQKFLVRDEETKKEPSQRSNEKSPAYSINIENLKVTLKTDSNKSSQEKDKLMDDGNEEFSLNIESLKIKHGSLVAVIGEVGSGKSTLFSTILGEITPKQGHVLTHGTVAYVPQNNWIFSETIRENILFGSKVSQRYHDVLHVCSLEEDLNIFPAGDQTQVGEYGWSLSGGQKSRINLARAAFTEKDVYLLDDPLSAVDGKVGETIFERCILKYLSNKTRILVTHQLQYLNQCDWVVIVHNGHLVEQGTFSDVSQTEAYKHLQYKREEKQSSSNYYVGTEKAPLAPWANGVGEEEYLQIKSGDGADEVSLNKTSRKLDIKVWWHYLTAGTLWGLAICVYSLLTFASIMCMVLADWWLLNWIQPADFEVSMYNTSNGSVAYMNITASSPDYIAYRDYQLEVYAVIIIGLIVAAEIRSLVFFIYTPSAAESLHNRMFKRIINAPIAFFEKTSVGRVLNRFSRDTNFMDELLPRNLSQVLTDDGGSTSDYKRLVNHMYIYGLKEGFQSAYNMYKAEHSTESALLKFHDDVDVEHWTKGKVY